MMGMGMMEIFLALFFLAAPSGPYGQPAPASTVFRHLPEGAVLVVGVDVASLAQGVDQGLGRILKAPFVKKSPVMQMAATAITTAKETMLQKARQLGIDPLKDIRYLMVALQPPHQGQERILLVAGGKFPPGIMDGLAGLTGAQKKDNMLIVDDDPENPMVLAKAGDKTLVFGSRPWVQDALAGEHKNKTMRSLLKDYGRDTYFMLAFRPNESIRADWKTEDPMARPLLAHFEAISVRFTYKSEIIKVLTDDPRFVAVYKGLLDGLGQMAVAGWQFAEGALAMGEAYLASLDPVAQLDANLPPEGQQVVRVLVDNRREIRKLVQQMFLGKKTRATASGLKSKRTAMLTISGHGPSSMMFLGVMLGGFAYAGSAYRVPPPVVEAPIGHQ
ncbi:MAG TPA: hypothetical protein VM425_07570 [Myxococcota bacterium]|nr:hypothetical protein [Myxococcota bacterium]